MARPTFSYPFAVDYPVSSPYGPRSGGMHTGTDFAVPSGVEILAANDGTVVYCAREDGAGNTVTIAGSDGWQSRYHHLERWTVTQGQSIHAGDRVGYCDSTGHSSGPHLHFEIRPTPSTTTDPVPILEADCGAGAELEPEPETNFATEDDEMLILDKSNQKMAILCGSHRPRLIESINDYQRGTFVSLSHEAFEQYFADAIEIFNAATR